MRWFFYGNQSRKIDKSNAYLWVVEYEVGENDEVKEVFIFAT